MKKYVYKSYDVKLLINKKGLPYHEPNSILLRPRHYPIRTACRISPPILRQEAVKGEERINRTGRNYAAAEQGRITESATVK